MTSILKRRPFQFILALKNLESAIERIQMAEFKK